jgi:hypothetical protein
VCINEKFGGLYGPFIFIRLVQTLEAELVMMFTVRFGHCLVSE